VDGSGNAYSGNAYVTGFTLSTEATFPATVGPDLTGNGGSDAFVAKVNAAGTGLVYCRYIGNSNNDSASGIAVDSSGNSYTPTNTSTNTPTNTPTVTPTVTQTPTIRRSTP
jgi:hypothetical protein